MFPQFDGNSLRVVTVWFFLLLRTHSSRGESQVIGPSQPIVATLGDDIILPCHLEPAEDVAMEILEWRRSDLKPELVNVWRAGQDLTNARNPSYRDRTSLTVGELKLGNISVKLSGVRLSDEGTYECFIPARGQRALVSLVVASDAVSSPVISLLGLDEPSGSVELQCGSAGWYPEPEVLWLDGERNLLPAGPTETLRGPDDLYTVNSRVTVDQRHSNNITCRVQQLRTNRTSESTMYIPDDFFMSPSSAPGPVIIVLAVCLVLCVLVIFTGLFFVWKQNRNKVRRRRCEDSDVEKKKNGWKTKEEEKQQEVLMIESQTRDEAVMEVEGGTDRDQTNKELKEAKRALDDRTAEVIQLKRQVDGQLAEMKMLREEKQSSDDKLQNHLKMENKEADGLIAEIKKLKEENQTKENKLQQQKKEAEGLKSEIKKLKEEKQQLQQELTKEKQAKSSWFPWQAAT